MLFITLRSLLINKERLNSDFFFEWHIVSDKGRICLHLNFHLNKVNTVLPKQNVILPELKANSRLFYLPLRSSGIHCLSPELEINRVKLHLPSMHQKSGTNSQKTAGLPKPSMLLNQDWGLLCLLLPSTLHYNFYSGIFSYFIPLLFHLSCFYFPFSWFLMTCFDIVCLNVLLLHVSFARLCLTWSTSSHLVAEMCFINKLAVQKTPNKIKSNIKQISLATAPTVLYKVEFKAQGITFSFHSIEWLTP